MRRFAKITTLIAVLSAALLVLAACGGGSGDTGGDSGDGGLAVEMGPGFVFKPAEIQVKTGEQVVIEVVNKDATEHSFVIADLDVNSGSVAGNGSTTVEFTAPEPGEYEIICDIPGHAEGGMVGKLIVTE